MTSQTCARCSGRFDIRTKRHRFKVCRNCIQNPDMMLPRSWTAKKGRHLLRHEAENVSIDLLEFKRDIYVHLMFLLFFLTVLFCFILFWHLKNADQPINVAVAAARGLVPKTKTWQLNLNNVIATTIVWHRDIVAAKCILYKGMFLYQM